MTWDSVVYAMMSISNRHVYNYLKSYKRASIWFPVHLVEKLFLHILIILVLGRGGDILSFASQVVRFRKRNCMS